MNLTTDLFTECLHDNSSKAQSVVDAEADPLTKNKFNVRRMS